VWSRCAGSQAGTDVFDRMSDFISTLFQSMDEAGDDDAVDNVILVTHGLLMRIFCMCYFKWTEAEFSQVPSPAPSPARPQSV
jgi:broad specificity phosphatase PhoE